MTTKQTMEVMFSLKKQGVKIFLTDKGWETVVKTIGESEGNDEVNTEEQVG